jgi:NADPH:quinone reductase-like Zn-dependent oxidoreductase
MKAYLCKKYGPPQVLQLNEVEKPKPGDNEILIKVRASTVNAADCNLRGLTYIPRGLGLTAKMMLGLNKPKKEIQGSVLAGDVVETGNGVKLFRPGDKVFGTGPELGAYGEYASRTESGALSIIPENISYEEAASVPYGALTALYFLQNIANIQEGQTILVKGASGGVGVYAVQLAHYFGA